MQYGKKPGRSSRSSAHDLPTSISLTVPEITQSVRTLYADELKPFGRVLLKRLRERAAVAVALSHGLSPDAVDPETMPRIDPRRLRKVCESGTGVLVVEPEEGKEYSVKLAGEAETFLDICSTDDPYSEDFWEHFSAYLQSLNEEDMLLPGGRYACARVLVGRKLLFLANLSLGQVCHVMQLAISRKKLLGYLDGSLVPYRHSEGWIKEQCALNQSTTGTGALPVASWEDAHMRLKELLDSEVNPAPGMITISNVKRLFRSRFQLELSETVFGYTKLFDLLNDPYFHDVCTLVVRGNGQVIVKRVRAAPAAPPGLWAFPVMMPLPMVPSGPEEFVPIESDSLVSPGATPRGSRPPIQWGDYDSLSFPKDSMSSSAGASTTDCCASDASSTSGCCNLLGEDGEPLEAPSSPSRASCSSSPRVKNTFIDLQIPTQDVTTKTGARLRATSVPKDLGSKARAAADAIAAPSVESPHRAVTRKIVDFGHIAVDTQQKLLQPELACECSGDGAFGRLDPCAACLGWDVDGCAAWWAQDISGLYHAQAFHVGPPGVWYSALDDQGAWVAVDQDGLVPWGFDLEVGEQVPVSV